MTCVYGAKDRYLRLVGNDPCPGPTPGQDRTNHVLQARSNPHRIGIFAGQPPYLRPTVQMHVHTVTRRVVQCAASLRKPRSVTKTITPRSQHPLRPAKQPAREYFSHSVTGPAWPDTATTPPSYRPSRSRPAVPRRGRLHRRPHHPPPIHRPEPCERRTTHHTSRQHLGPEPHREPGLLPHSRTRPKRDASVKQNFARVAVRPIDFFGDVSNAEFLVYVSLS